MPREKADISIALRADISNAIRHHRHFFLDSASLFSETRTTSRFRTCEVGSIMNTLRYWSWFVFIVSLFAVASLGAGAAKDDRGPFKNLKFRSIGPAAGGRVSRAC